MINVNDILNLNISTGTMFQTKDKKIVSLDEAKAKGLEGKIIDVDTKSEVAKALFGTEKIGTTEIKAAIKILVLAIGNVNYASQVPLSTEDKNKVLSILEPVLAKPARAGRKKKK